MDSNLELVKLNVEGCCDVWKWPSRAVIATGPQGVVFKTWGPWDGLRTLRVPDPGKGGGGVLSICYPGFSVRSSAAIGYLHSLDCNPSIASRMRSFPYSSPELGINSLHHFIIAEQMLFCRQWDSNLEWSGRIKPIWDDPPISVLWHQGWIALQSQILPISVIELFHWGKWRAAKVTDHILWVLWQRLVIRNQLAAEGRITRVAVTLFTLHQVVIDNVLMMVKSGCSSVPTIWVWEANKLVRNSI